MRFDKPFIAIRDRSILEIFDLALHVLTDHFKPLFWLMVFGIAPWVVLDFYLVGWMIDTDDFIGVYYWVMLLLVLSQAQVGTTFMTYYLGEAMFVGRPGVWATIREVFKTSPYFLWLHGALRTVVPVILCCLGMASENWDAVGVLAILVIPGLVILGLGVRAFRPFVSEILMLEWKQVSKKQKSHISFGKRTSTLHGISAGDLFGRFVICCVFAIPLMVACFSMFVIIDSALSIQANSDYSYLPYYWVAALWIVSGFVSITRFLSYIDIRIRQEGWAVELKMRAEGQLLLDAID